MANERSTQLATLLLFNRNNI